MDNCRLLASEAFGTERSPSEVRDGGVSLKLRKIERAVPGTEVRWPRRAGREGRPAGGREGCVQRSRDRPDPPVEWSFVLDEAFEAIRIFLLPTSWAAWGQVVNVSLWSPP